MTDQSASRVLIAPSILAADPSALADAVREAEAAGADAFHVDVMDGHFVPEIAFGRRWVESLRKLTRLPLDVHLMVSNPERHVEPFAKAGADSVTFHAEAAGTTDAIHAVAEHVRAAGAQTGVALKPATSPDVLNGLWDVLDLVLVMTVEPGYSGQAFMSDQLSKIEQLRRTISEQTRERHITIAVDGGIDERTLGACVQAGARYLVAGSSVYSIRRSVREGIAALRAAVQQT
jgi:ribulose-phosphate 3-epimerase